MSPNKNGCERSRLPLPEGGPRIRLAAPAGRPTAEFEAFQPVTLIGSRRDCDLSISRGDVSKIHCALVNTGSAIIATDLCSRSGTAVNGRPVSVATLGPGDDLRVGSVPIVVEFLVPPENAQSAAGDADDANFTLPVPLRLIGSEQQYELMTLPAIIGRRQACRVVLDTPDVSLAHALIFTIEGCPAIFDLGSRSGTYVNAQHVTLAWLHSGDRLCIGGEELTLAWDGPQHAADQASATAAADAGGPLQLNGLEDLGSMIAGLKAQISTPEARLRERTSALDQQETDLEARITRADDERATFAPEKGQCAHQAAESQAAWLRLDSQRAELRQRLAEYEARLGELEAREAALDQRQAALAATEKTIAQRQAKLAKRETACAEAVRSIEQLKATLSDARHVFGSIGAAVEQPVTSDLGVAAPGNPAAESDDRSPLPADGAPANPVLPAPLVDKPLFTGFDSSSRQ